MDAFERGLKDRVANGVEADWICHICGANQKEAIGKGGELKTDGESRVWCTACIKKSFQPKTIVYSYKLPGRNELCKCGSELKFKHCCLKKKAK